MSQTLTVGCRYDVDSLNFVAWTKGDGSSIDGYNTGDYFTLQGYYLGPDDHGIEPIFSHSERPENRRAAMREGLEEAE